MAVQYEEPAATEAACWSVWAKSGRDEGKHLSSWLPLYQHLDDTAGVAGMLVDHWVSPQSIARMASRFPDGIHGVRMFATWLAGTHDVGKVSPAFSVQVPDLTRFMAQCGLDMPSALAKDPMRPVVNHALVGHTTAREWLRDRLQFPRELSSALGSVIGSHHGVPPEQANLTTARRHTRLAGTGLWSAVRESLLRRATDRLGGMDALREYSSLTLELPTQVLLTAIVILADWIASNQDFFPLLPLSTLYQPPAPDEQVTARRLAAGWAQLDLPPRWTPQPFTADIGTAIHDRFGLHGARPVQEAAVRVATMQPEPGLLIIEAPMGEGKTEAALLAAEVLAARTQADGCFIALPTQATSDAMFDRVAHWLDHLPGRVDGAHLSVRLAHGKAHLNDTFDGLVRKGYVGSIGEGDHEALVAHRWLSGRKKGVLASFVVGTVDQVLFAALRSRHLMLRHLALAGKVVVIDEVHAYDVYMSQYLHRTLHWLGAYRVPVILLSATLPSARRAQLVAAYESGRGGDHPTNDADTGYPMVTGSGVPAHQVVASRPSTSVILRRLPDDLDSLVTYLRAQLAEGGCAAVIRNTVTRVQETAQRLAEEFGAEHITVDHARFLSCDRARIDRSLVATFGRSSANRPDLHIVIGSQVLEQSLDVDFDIMVSDLAPTDLILQRIGRLHRHDRPRPKPLVQAECALVGVDDWASEPVIPVRGSRRVYGLYPLLRSAALLGTRAAVELPSDIPDLVEKAYGTDDVGTSAWQPALRTARAAAERSQRDRAAAAQGFLLGEVGPPNRDLVGWVSAGVGDLDDDPQGRAQVRDGEESLEVLVVQSDRHGGLLTPSWIERGGGRQIPLDLAMPKSLARVIASCSLRLPLALSHGGVIEETIKALESNCFPSFQQSPLLEGQLVLVLDENCQSRLRLSSGEFELTYDPAWGLIHERR
ncbi:MAG TPA: CRISPR-associated helicase Cas3' [Pseudonocardiaceae bacterium]|nr:CRISPR-associated helicase Cas3' [Pseudonocardiaceae bacterium]